MSRPQRDPGIPRFKVSQNPGIFFTIHLERSYAKNCQHLFSLFIRVNPVPKNPEIPGFGKIPGLKILIPLGPVRTT